MMEWEVENAGTASEVHTLDRGGSRAAVGLVSGDDAWGVWVNGQHVFAYSNLGAAIARAETELGVSSDPGSSSLEWSHVRDFLPFDCLAEKYVASKDGCDCEVYRRPGDSEWWLHVLFYHGSMYASRFKSLQAAKAKAPRMMEWAAEAASWRA